MATAVTTTQPGQGAPTRVILGLMTCGPDESVGTRITDLEIFNDALHVFQERGYRDLDTARVYLRGKQEAFSRSAGWSQRGLSVATKVKYPNEPGDIGRQGVLESVETSLRELGTDHVDVLNLHAADRATPFFENLSVLNELYEAGRFTRLGLSNLAAFEGAEVATLCAQQGLGQANHRPTYLQRGGLWHRARAGTVLPKVRPRKGLGRFRVIFRC